jgi:hypothetical protein
MTPWACNPTQQNSKSKKPTASLLSSCIPVTHADTYGILRDTHRSADKNPGDETAHAKFQEVCFPAASLAFGLSFRYP